MGKLNDTCPRFVWVSDRVGAISEAVFAPGYHFCPNDNDLLTYLRSKNMEQDLDIVNHVIKVIDVYKHFPGELLKMHLPIGEQELYFFCPVTMKYLSGLRVKRSSGSGNWRITGQDRKLYGMMMRTLVFYDSEHKRTNWVMHEYRLEEKELSEKKQKSEVNYVLCKLYEKSEPNVKDSQQAGAYFKQRESKDGSYCDKIVIIPETLISSLSGMKCLSMNASVLGVSVQSSAYNGSNTPNVLQNTDKVNNVLCKTYEMTEPDVVDTQKDGAFFSKIEMKDNPEPLISKLSGSEHLPMNTAIQGESLQSSADHDNKTLVVLGNTDKVNNVLCKTYEMTEPDIEDGQKDGAFFSEIEMQDNPEPIISELSASEYLPINTYIQGEPLQAADHGKKTLAVLGNTDNMHTEDWDSSTDFNTFNDLGCGRMMSDMYVDEFGWFCLPNVRDGSDIHMENLSGWDTNGRMLSGMSIDESDWFVLPYIWDGTDTYVEDLSECTPG